MIRVGLIEFGEIDAKNEVFTQRRIGSNIFKNSFLVPPGVDTDKVLSGARYFIHGQKGCGKTALLLYLKDKFDELGSTTRTILFKSNITEVERQKIAQGMGFELVIQNGSEIIEYDYKINWLWYIYRNLFRMITKDHVMIGWDTVDSLKRLLGVHNEVSTGLLADIQSKRIKLHAKAALNAGPFTAEIQSEIEALSNINDSTEIEIIEIIERYICKFDFHPRKRCILLFDELELFWNKIDQRNRDLFLIRDLLYAVSRVNRIISDNSAAMVVIASVRSEVLHEVNRIGPEISRDVDDLGVRINWNSSVQDNEQPILKIVASKINASEIENDAIPTDDVWESYFPRIAFGRDFRKFLLDNTMFRPRNIVNLLKLARDHRPDHERILIESIDQVQLEFSKRTWRETEEELAGEFGPISVSAIKNLLIGFEDKLNTTTISNRIDELCRTNPATGNELIKIGSEKIISSLYRIGVIGNKYTVSGSGKKEQRYGWIFRDNYEPLLDKDFIIHESLKKALQIPF